MAVSKLNPLYFYPPQTPVPTQKPQSPSPSPLPLKNPSPTLRLKTQLMIPVLMSKLSPKEQEDESPHHQHYEIPDYLSVAFPSLAFSSTLFFKSAIHAQVSVDEDEPEDVLLGRFRREVFKSNVMRECKRRMFFESAQEKRKRKTRDAARRNRKRRPRPKVSKQAKEESAKKKSEGEDDNWEFVDVDLPYC